jgi:hypothetical protein
MARARHHQAGVDVTCWPDQVVHMMDLVDTGGGPPPDVVLEQLSVGWISQNDLRQRLGLAPVSGLEASVRP